MAVRHGIIAGCLSLMACGGRSLEWVEPACDEPVAAEWGLVGTLLRTGSTDGAFSEDPPPEAVVSREGIYKPGNGDLAWTDVWDADHRIDTVQVEGFGTVFADGDLDLAFDRTTTSRDGEASTRQVRVLRVGCDMEVSEREGGEVVYLENATFRRSVYDFRYSRIQANIVAEGEGEATPDGAAFLTEAWRIGDIEHQWEREIEADGLETATFQVRNADRVAAGEVDVLVGGATAWDFEVTDGRTTAQWRASLGPAGNGRGEVTLEGPFDDVTCDIEIEGDSCTVQSQCESAPRPPCWRVERDLADRNSPCCDP